ncbi:MAG: CopG family transcriptional regulator [Acidobacteriota bacterium]
MRVVLFHDDCALMASQRRSFFPKGSGITQVMMDMDPYMELVKKTTILFPPDLYEQLSRLARQRDTSIGELVRSACRDQYGLATKEARLDLVRQMAEMNLPVGTPQEMKRQSVPEVEPLP